MTDERAIVDLYPFANEAVAGDFAIAPDADAFLNLHEGANSGVIADLTAIEVDEVVDLHAGAKFDVSGDAPVTRPLRGSVFFLFTDHLVLHRSLDQIRRNTTMSIQQRNKSMPAS